MMEDLEENEFVWLRYIGMCQAPMTPYERVQQDQVKRKHGIYAAFLKLLVPQPPEAEAFHFPLAELPGTASQAEKDVRERILIALLRLPYLLNQQAGGFHARYQPLQETEDLWRRSGCRVFQLYQDQMTDMPPERVALFKEWEELGRAMKAHPVETGWDQMPKTPERLDAVFHQAIPGETEI